MGDALDQEPVDQLSYRHCGVVGDDKQIDIGAQLVLPAHHRAAQQDSIDVNPDRQLAGESFTDGAVTVRAGDWSTARLRFHRLDDDAGDGGGDAGAWIWQPARTDAFELDAAGGNGVPPVA